MISLEIAPYFYALSENYGSPEEDYLIAYHEGRLTQASKQVYETLLDNGALNTLDLRKKAKLANAKDSEFNKALEQLQRDFKILPVGVAQAGAWNYSHIYEIVTRHYPNLSEQARIITELFGWGNEVVKKVVNKLMENGTLVMAEHPKHSSEHVEGSTGEWVALKELIK
jgi:hypothetical protein